MPSPASVMVICLRFIVLSLFVGLVFSVRRFWRLHKLRRNSSRKCSRQFKPTQKWPYGVLSTRRDRLFCNGCDGDEYPCDLRQESPVSCERARKRKVNITPELPPW